MGTVSGARLWVRRFLPWVVTIAVVVGILVKYPIDKILDEARRGDALAMVPFAIGMPLVHLISVAMWDALVLSPTIPGMTWFDAARGRAASAVLLVLGYAFGHGGYGAWIARKTGSGGRTAVGLILYLSASDLVGVTAVAGVAVWLGGSELPAATRNSVGIIAPLVAVVLASLALFGPWLNRRWKEESKFLRPWATVPPGRYAIQQLGRCFNIGVGIVATWAAANAFGLPLPLGVVASYLPIILLVGALPINIAGLGAVQAAWLLFEPWASGPQILAFQFIWHLMVAGMLVVRGLPFLRRVLREIEAGHEGAQRQRS